MSFSQFHTPCFVTSASSFEIRRIFLDNTIKIRLLPLRIDFAFFKDSDMLISPMCPHPILEEEPKFPKKSNFRRSVTRNSWNILNVSRNSGITMTPFRLLFSLPNGDLFLRSMDLNGVNYISDGVETCGFRPYEPCCVNDPIPAFEIRRNTLGGNHRVAGTRVCAQVLLYTLRVSENGIHLLMALLRE